MRDSSPIPVRENTPPPAVSYFENPLLPGKKMFLCTGLNASLAVDSCKTMFEQANGKEAPDSLMRCRGCKVGALHAGRASPDASTLWGSNLCCRCGRTDMRLIGGTVCVSCKNREYECVKGRNAKGKKPAKHPSVERRSLRYCIGGEVKTITRNSTTSTAELVFELLRDSGKRVLIGHGARSQRVFAAQESLF